MQNTDWVACPHCGGEIKRTAKACRHCGSDDNTGWSSITYMDGIDYPEESDYLEGLEKEGFVKTKPTGGRLIIAAIALGLVLLFAWGLFKSAF